jgi:hypothetical protein
VGQRTLDLERKARPPDRGDDTSGRGLAFIVGHYKSGSTWLINLLSLHPEVRGVGETSIFPYVCSSPDLQASTALLFGLGFWGRGGLRDLARNRLAEWARPLRRCWKPVLGPRERPTTRMDLGLLDQLALRRALARCESREEYCRQFFHHLRKGLRPRAYLIEKNNNIFHVPFIKSVFPDAKLIAISRDGRDVLVSEKYFLRNEAGRAQSFEASVRQWRQAMEAQFRYAEEYGIHTLSYEGLLADPAPLVRELLQFLGLPDDAETVADMIHRSSFQFITGRKPGQEKRDSFYRKGTAGDWKNHFTAEDSRTFKEIAGDLLIRLGYERDDHW